MSAQGETAIPEPGEPLAELSQEHAFVQPLLKRLMEIGHRVHSGQPVDPRTALIGVSLLDAYLHRVHVGEEDRDLRPDVELMVRGRCATHLGHMSTNHSEMCRRAQQLLLDIRLWATGDAAAQARVGRGIIELATRDYEAVQYEEAYALACLRSAIPEGAQRLLKSRLEDHAGTRKALEVRIGQFLDGTYRT